MSELTDGLTDPADPVQSKLEAEIRGPIAIAT